MTDKPNADLDALAPPDVSTELQEADASVASRLVDCDGGQVHDATSQGGSVPGAPWADFNSVPGQAKPIALSSLPDPEKWRLQTLVRGGTTTSAYDREMAGRLADADERRAADEADKSVARVPIEQGGGLIFEHKLSDPVTAPRVGITYVGYGKEPLLEQLCELVSDDISGENTLIFVCPECFRRGVPTQFAQCHVRATHRAWHVDTRTAGQVQAIKNSDNASGLEYYVSAGIIMDTDVLRCSNANCSCGFKIHKNIMYRVK